MKLLTPGIMKIIVNTDRWITKDKKLQRHTSVRN